MEAVGSQYPGPIPYPQQMNLWRGSVVGWGIMLQAGRSPVRVPDEVDFFNLPYSFHPHYGPGPGVDSASNRNEYQESSWS
jgi:hypothetical protein